MILEKLNHFEKFDFSVNFQINDEDLEDKYLELQKKFHPDTASDQTEAQINSILINQAYEILKKPVKRAIYLLQLQGIDIDCDDCLVKPSHENLIFVMEIREEIMENPDNQNQIKKEIKKTIFDEMPAVIDFMSRGDYLNAAQKLIKIKYLDKIISDLKKK
ncbi:MAG: molecular chaperone HscB [Rickettsiales bacterium]|jgi:molecular chaperone HscB